ncbi:hypothetical protein ACQY0O_004344 [Thecaphora frezii]
MDPRPRPFRAEVAEPEIISSLSIRWGPDTIDHPIILKDSWDLHQLSSSRIETKQMPVFNVHLLVIRQDGFDSLSDGTISPSFAALRRGDNGSDMVAVILGDASIVNTRGGPSDAEVGTVFFAPRERPKGVRGPSRR